MAQEKDTLLGVLRKAGLGGDVDFLRQGLQALMEALMELEVEERVGAGRYQRSPARRNWRNGWRRRGLSTRVGELLLSIPKLRRGSYFPSFLEPRRRAERALLSVVQEAYVLGVSSRKMERLLSALGLEGVSKSRVSRLCAALDRQVEGWRQRPLSGSYPYLWLDATYVKVREGERVLSQALVLALGVREDGEREVLGLEVGPTEEYAFWLEFLRGLVARGLRGVRLVVSDAHQGLRRALEEALVGASWQRCVVHFQRNALARVPRSSWGEVAALLSGIFAQPSLERARRELREVAEGLAPRFPRVAEMLWEAEEDLLAHMAFPRAHWRSLRSTNPLERVHVEIKRRVRVVGVFPNRQAALRLVGAVLMEQQQEWQGMRRYMSPQSLEPLLEVATA
jgi:putative transposase